MEDCQMEMLSHTDGALTSRGADIPDDNTLDESRTEHDDGRAHRERQAVQYNMGPRGSIQSPRREGLYPPAAARTATPDAPASPSNTVVFTTETAGDCDSSFMVSTANAAPVMCSATGRPYITLCQAVQDGKEEIVKCWLQYNKSRNQSHRNHYVDKRGFCPIHYAAKFNHTKIMRLLCSEDGRADVCAATTVEKYTPLHLAAHYNPRDVYESTARDDMDSDPGQPASLESFTLSFTRQLSSEEAVKFLVGLKEVDVNAKDRYSITPLHLACQVGNFDGVRVLLTDERVKLGAKDGNGDTPLHEACFHGKEMITILLLEKMKESKKLELTVRNDLGLTPFHLACREGHRRIVDLLLEYSTDPSKLVMEADNEGATPLHFACQNDDAETVKALLQHKADVFARTSHGMISVHVAAQFGSRKVMLELLNDPQVAQKDAVNAKDDYSQTPLHFAAENEKLEMMRLLLENGADKDARDIDYYTPLLTAAEFGRVQCFKVLLQHGASLEVKNKDGRNAVFLAAGSNHPQIIEDILLHHGIRSEAKKLLSTPDTLLNTPLHIAAEKGNVETLRLLLGRGKVKTSAKNVLRKSAMHLAAEKGHLHIVAELEDFCPDIAKSTDENGDTPLHLACSYGFVEVAECLIKGGADIEARNAVSRTPIGCAAFYGHSRVIELLVELKADIDAKGKLKATPLLLAAKEGHVTAVETLLRHQASMTTLDQRKFNALDWAIENGHNDVAEAIVKSLKWRSALTNYTRTQNGEITSPFRKLIKRMPGVAEVVLNKCTTTNADRNVRPDSEDFAVTFDYRFLEDREQAELADEVDSDKQSDEQRQGKEKKKRWFWSLFDSQKLKHPMRVMVESRRTELLKHPLVYKLIEDKWHIYGYTLFYSALALHALFFAFLMAFSLVLLNPLSPTCLAVSSGQFGLHRPGEQVKVNISQLRAPHNAVVVDYLNAMNVTVTDGAAGIDGFTLCFNTTAGVRDALSSVLPVEPICGQCGLSSSKMMFLKAAAVLIILCSIVRLGLKVIYFTQQLHLYYFDISTWVNLPLYIFSIIFVFVFTRECLCPFEWQWKFGIAAVFLVWAHLIFFMRRMRVLDTGIYVLMFKTIFIRFLKLTILTVLLLLMFAVTFYMTFRQFHSLFVNSPFSNVGHSVLKTIAMSIGDLGYDELFRQPSGGSSDVVPSIPFPVISYVLWIVFIILIPILFSNLLVGLAVDDIKGILEAAALTRLALRVELLLSLEDRFHFLKHVGYFRNCNQLQVKRVTQTIYPHKGRNNSTVIQLVIKLLRGENYTSPEHILHALNPTKTPFEQQTQTLMREISKIQEILQEIPKMQEALYKLLKQAESTNQRSKDRVVPN